MRPDADHLGATDRQAAGLPARDLPVWVDQVSKWYGPVIGVNEVTARIEGGVVALLGTNGAGKSTFLKLLTGQLRPSIGHVRVFGRSVRSPAARRRIGYCPDVDAFYEEMTARRFLLAMVRLAGFPYREAVARTDRTLALVGMTEGHRRLRGCSKGMRQRVKLAQALAHEPSLLILDEPLSGLDPIGRQEFCALFRRLADEGVTILLSSHVMAEVRQLADRVLLLQEGRLVTQGDWAGVLRFVTGQRGAVTIDGTDVRPLVADMLREASLRRLTFHDDHSCTIEAAEGEGSDALCDRIAALVCNKDYRIDRLETAAHWASPLFSRTGG